MDVSEVDRTENAMSRAAPSLARGSHLPAEDVDRGRLGLAGTAEARRAPRAALLGTAKALHGGGRPTDAFAACCHRLAFGWSVLDLADTDAEAWNGCSLTRDELRGWPLISSTSSSS